MPGKMGYEDFVWFILSEEDKTTDTALEYWFRCVDLDCDGELRSNELLVRAADCSMFKLSGHIPCVSYLPKCCAGVQLHTAVMPNRTRSSLDHLTSHHVVLILCM